MHLAYYRTIPAYILLLLFLLPQGLLAQDPAGASRLVIPDGTVVHLRLTQTVSSAQARAGDPLVFTVEKDVRVGDSIIIPAGSAAQGSVTRVKHRRFLGIGGDVVFNLDSVELVNGETVCLRARKEVKGISHTWRMIAEVAVASLVYLPAAPVFLFSRGGASTVLKNTQIKAQIDGSTSVLSAELPRTGETTSGLNSMMDNLAPRVLDGEGRERDMVNLVFIAQDNDLQAAFKRAGWVKTDAWKLVMAWHLLTKRTHDATLPMARFYMYGRVQDYSYALPEPGAIVSRRHHLRIWKTDDTVNGTPIWAGAATHDIAIEYGKRGHLINHTIDPNVDIERDFIGTNLTGATLVRREEYLHGIGPAQTSSGADYYSDGRILLLDLHQTTPSVAKVPASSLSVARSQPALALTSAGSQ
ncbi:MAG TPA: LssY C-terminal domain-containing protein [Terriglobales bacterium]|nr:LssY C-terminal domain-containing protein [Terriglobales bacterium]